MIHSLQRLTAVSRSGRAIIWAPVQRPAWIRANALVSIAVGVFLGSAGFVSGAAPEPPSAPDDDARLPCGPDLDILDPVHRRMAERLLAGDVAHRHPPAFCVAPGTRPEVIDLLEEILYGRGTRFQLGSRWTQTAYDGPNSGQGNPTTISYSFVPDGVSVPNGVGEGVAANNLFATMNGQFSSTAQWQNLFHQAFDSWSSMTGITYVFEPSDDGASLHFSQGVSGVRGDVRISAKLIDGGSGILAFNYFPNNGDMILDSGENWAAGPGNNFLFMRNIIAHEHGHGIGLSHVCPITQTILMEPFLSTAFDGPQHDDIRGGQRAYGDPFEENNTPAEATPLGLIGGSFTVTDVSMDDNDESDYYSFDVGTDKQVTLTLTPIGLAYAAGPQVDPCNVGGLIESHQINNLDLELLDSDGATVLGSASNVPAGELEQICDVILPPAGGTFFARVISGPVNGVQLYELGFDVVDSSGPADFAITFPAGTPGTVTPNAATPIQIETVNGAGAADPTSGLLHYRIDGAPEVTEPLAHVGPIGGGDAFLATLPSADCLSTIEWFVTLGDLGGADIVQEPPACPGLLIETRALVSETILLDDDLETDMGWTAGAVGDDATTGIWVRVDPNGTVAQPEDDHTPDPAALCFVTGQGSVGGTLGENDVDGGRTTLLSPTFNATQNSTLVNYWRWYSNNTGAAPNADVFVIDISNDNGSTWTNVETVGPSGPGTSGGWVRHEFVVEDVVAPTALMKMRFTASDLGSGSLVEAGVDDFRVTEIECVGACASACGDIDGSGGNVTLVDFAAFALCFGSAPSGSESCLCSDLDANGTINLFDFATFALLFDNAPSGSIPNCGP